MTDQFEHRDMAGAVFRDVNLHAAVFDDVNLAEATIRNANLNGVSITDANIRGLTIFGFRIDQLIDAELDRRDPERVRLRMVDVFDPAEVARVLSRLDEVRAAFYARLRAALPEVVDASPGPERWSALKHARHLLFAEELYLNRWLLRNDQPLSVFGLLPPFLANNPAFAEVGTDPTGDLEAVLSAWDAVHISMRAFVSGVTPDVLRRVTSDVDFGQGTVGQVLQGMASHDLWHIRMAESALVDVSAA